MSLLKTYVYTSNINFLVCHEIKLRVLCTICNHIYVFLVCLFFWFVYSIFSPSRADYKHFQDRDSLRVTPVTKHLAH